MTPKQEEARRRNLAKARKAAARKRKREAAKREAAKQERIERIAGPAPRRAKYDPLRGFPGLDELIIARTPEMQPLLDNICAWASMWRKDNNA